MVLLFASGAWLSDYLHPYSPWKTENNLATSRLYHILFGSLIWTCGIIFLLSWIAPLILSILLFCAKKFVETNLFLYGFIGNFITLFIVPFVHSIFLFEQTHSKTSFCHHDFMSHMSYFKPRDYSQLTVNKGEVALFCTHLTENFVYGSNSSAVVLY